MSLDLQKDARRLRLFICIAAAFLLAVIGLVSYRSLNTSWQTWQDLFCEMRTVSGKQMLGISQQDLYNGRIERCTTCHLGMNHIITAQGEVPKVFRSHPNAFPTSSHIKRGCSLCHGGTPRALDRLLAHALPGTRVRDPRMSQPHIQASCAACHTPGDQPGQERLVLGALLFSRLGCNICHPLTAGGRGGWDFGPDLKSMGRKSLAYLKASLVNPTANFPRSTMPSFQSSFEKNPDPLEDLIIFLESLSLDPRLTSNTHANQQSILSNSACIECHSGVGGKAVGRFRHRCVYILERSNELSCKRCHPGSLPPQSRRSNRARHYLECPLISQHRSSCCTCHNEVSRRGYL